jgi:hypothetical protein
MKTKLPRGPEGLFGSTARARILGYLAAASGAKTGYEVAKALGLGPSNVYPELARLERWGVVACHRDVAGRKRFVLSDEDLRSFLVRRVRVMDTAQWLSGRPVARREARAKEAAALPLNVPGRRSNRPRPPAADELRPRPEKERALRRLRRTASRRS